LFISQDNLILVYNIFLKYNYNLIIYNMVKLEEDEE